jgi:hypothetical protein
MNGAEEKECQNWTKMSFFGLKLLEWKAGWFVWLTMVASYGEQAFFGYVVR